MRVLIIVPQQSRISGNWVTAQRFQKGLEAIHCQVHILDVPPDDRHKISAQLDSFKPDIALLLHAYRTGQPWHRNDISNSTPYVVMLTGTDINQGFHDVTQREVIDKVLSEANAIVMQNTLQAESFVQQQSNLASKLYTPAPGIILGEKEYDLSAYHQLDKTKTLFLCPAGLRPVKGILELVELLDQAHLVSSNFQVAFCGPKLDPVYSERFLQSIETKEWAHYLGAIPPDAMASAMRQADLILNNSSAEGLSNSLLEAETLGVPILARNIPGNSAIVKHGVNGFLYTNLNDFKTCINKLLDPEVRLRLSRPAPDKYSQENEAKELHGILKKALANKY